MYLYLAVSPTAVSAALIREEGGVQKPVYFISKALRGSKGKVSKDGEASLCPCHSIKEASAIFSTSHYSGPYQISFEEG
jgi:hypothetical protein